MKFDGKIRRWFAHIFVLLMGCLLGWYVEKIFHGGRWVGSALADKLIWMESGALGLWIFWNMYALLLAQFSSGDFSKSRRHDAWTYLPFVFLLLHPGMVPFVKSLGRGQLVSLWLGFLIGTVLIVKLIYAVAVFSSVRWAFATFGALCLGFLVTLLHIKPPSFFEAFTFRILVDTQFTALAILGVAALLTGITKRKRNLAIVGAAMLIVGVVVWRSAKVPPPAPPTLPGARNIMSFPQAQSLGLFAQSKGIFKVRIKVLDEQRDVLHFIKPAEISETVAIGPKSALRFGVAVPFFAPGLSDAGVDFSLSANSQVIWTHKLDPLHRREDRDWHDFTVDLGPWGGTTVELTLRTEGADHGSISTPRLFSPDRKSQRPNVVVLLVDTLRADHVGFGGYKRQTSPKLSIWASKGTVFENTISTAPWTEPATVTLLTGMLPDQMGLGFFMKVMLSPDSKTIGEYLREEGYMTAAFSGNPMICTMLRFNQGFDTFSDRCTEYFDHRSGECLTGEAIEWIDSRAESPFLLYIHYIDPHDPYNPAQPYKNRFSLGYTGKNEKIRKGQITFRRDQQIKLPDSDVQYLMDQYDGEIAYADEQIERFLRYLSDRGILDNTILVITSDHGEELLEHGILGHFFNLHQTLLHVPLIFIGQGIPAGMRVKEPVSLADVLPTILDSLDITPEKNVWGKSLMPLISGKKEEPRFCFSQMDSPERQQWSMVRGRYKLIMSKKSRKKELYDIRNDPGEFRNLAGTGIPEEEILYKEILHVLDWINNHRVRPWMGSKDKRRRVEKDRLRRMKALGYIGN